MLPHATPTPVPTLAPARLPPAPTNKQYHELFHEFVPLVPNPYPHGVTFRVSVCLTRTNFAARKQEPLLIVFVQHHDLNGEPEPDFDDALRLAQLRPRQPAHLPVGPTLACVVKAMNVLRDRVRTTYGVGFPEPANCKVKLDQGDERAALEV